MYPIYPKEYLVILRYYLYCSWTTMGETSPIVFNCLILEKDGPQNVHQPAALGIIQKWAGSGGRSWGSDPSLSPHQIPMKKPPSLRRKQTGMVCLQIAETRAAGAGGAPGEDRSGYNEAARLSRGQITPRAVHTARSWDCVLSEMESHWKMWAGKWLD